MSYSTLITAETLKNNINNPDWVIFDCRFLLANTEAGANGYRLGHIPNARYAHLDYDLSSTITSLTGRHPLPNLISLAKKLSLWGVHHQSQVITYDDTCGAFAGRLWWLLRLLGHKQTAVLNGGLQYWQQKGYSITTTLPKVYLAEFKPYLPINTWIKAQDVEKGLANRSICLIDARTPERYSGKNEPIDPVAGHIPGALNRPFQLNLDSEGLFLPPNELSAQFNELKGTTPAEQVVHMCGSGVTACHNVLAMEYAGLAGSKLYAGSWSEWITNKNRATTQA
jgi:thiosulfate/3-mercaptopyruvate sulfurtransferase